MRDQAVALNRLLEQSANTWMDSRTYEGLSQPMRVLHTELCLLIGERVPVFVAGYSYPHDDGPELGVIIFTEKLVIQAIAEQGAIPVADVVKRSDLRTLRIVEAPNLVLPAATFAGHDPNHLQLRLDFEGGMRIDLPGRSPSHSQREALLALLPALVEDLER